MIAKVNARRLSYLEPGALGDLADAVLSLRRRRVGGILIEAGCALGGSTAVLVAAKKRRRVLRVFDVFGQIPPPSPRDGGDVQQRYEVIAAGEAAGPGGDPYYGYIENLEQQVLMNLSRLGLDAERNRVQLVAGLFEETLRIQEPVALLHVDCDWHDSEATVLQRVGPSMTRGGCIIVDDYDHWSGCRAAVDEFLDSESGSRFRVERRNRVHLVPE